MELPPPHVLLQLDAIIVAQRESDGATSPRAQTRRRRSASRLMMSDTSSESRRRRQGTRASSRHDLRPHRKNASGLRIGALREPSRKRTASGAAACSPAANSTTSTSTARPRSSARSGARNIALRPETTGATYTKIRNFYSPRTRGAHVKKKDTTTKLTKSAPHGSAAAAPPT